MTMIATKKAAMAVRLFQKKPFLFHFGNFHEDESENDHGRAPDVGAEVEGVRFQGLAVMLARRTIEYPGTEKSITMETP